MKLDGIVLDGAMEQCIYAAAYGTEFANISLPNGPPSYQIVMAATRAATAGRRAVEAFRKMRKDVEP